MILPTFFTANKNNNNLFNININTWLLLKITNNNILRKKKLC